MSAPSMATRLRATRKLAAHARAKSILDSHDALTLLAAMDHVIDVLRDAQAEGGGYGFVRDLLAYLGADQEVQG